MFRQKHFEKTWQKFSRLLEDCWPVVMSKGWERRVFSTGTKPKGRGCPPPVVLSNKKAHQEERDICYPPLGSLKAPLLELPRCSPGGTYRGRLFREGKDISAPTQSWNSSGRWEESNRHVVPVDSLRNKGVRGRNERKKSRGRPTRKPKHPQNVWSARRNSSWLATTGSTR